MIRAKKLEIWKRKVNDTKNSKAMWRLVQSLSNPRSPKNSRALEHLGHVRTTNRQKARAFIQHYAAKSRLKLNKDDKWTERKVNEWLRGAKDQESEYNQVITLEEVRAALHKVDGRKCEGPDNIHPRMLHRLGPTAMKYLVELFNQTWTGEKFLQIWRTADIRPIHKKGKDPQRVDSYRPISLTSVVGKLLERVICNRLKHYLETGDKLNENQAGFRPRRSTEDQLLKLSQSISDGF